MLSGRLEGDLEQTMKGTGNRRHHQYVDGPLVVPCILNLNTAMLSTCVSQFLVMYCTESFTSFGSAYRMW